eukprot:403372192
MSAVKNFENILQQHPSVGAKNVESIIPMKLKSRVKVNLLEEILEMKANYLGNVSQGNNSQIKSNTKSAFQRKLEEIENKKRDMLEANTKAQQQSETQSKVQNQDLVNPPSQSEKMEKILNKRKQKEPLITDFFLQDKRQAYCSQGSIKKQKVFHIFQDTTDLKSTQNTSNVNSQQGQFTIDSIQLTVDPSESTFDGYNGSSQIQSQNLGEDDPDELEVLYVKRVHKILLKKDKTCRKKALRKINLQKIAIFDQLTDADNSNHSSQNSVKQERRKRKQRSKNVFSNSNIKSFKETLEKLKSINKVENDDVTQEERSYPQNNNNLDSNQIYEDSLEKYSIQKQDIFKINRDIQNQ